MALLRITRQINCKAVEQIATLIHRQYNRDWGTSYSRPPIDPYLTSPLLQNPGSATVDKLVRKSSQSAGNVPMSPTTPMQQANCYALPPQHFTSCCCCCMLLVNSSFLQSAFVSTRSAIAARTAQNIKHNGKRLLVFKRLQRKGDLTVFKMAAIRHLGFLKFNLNLTVSG